MPDDPGPLDVSARRSHDPLCPPYLGYSGLDDGCQICDALADARAEVLDVLEDVLTQACTGPGDRWRTFDSSALTAYADGLLLLAAHGRLRITHHAGRRVIAERIDHA